MAFSISHRIQNGLDLVWLTDEDQGTQAAVLPALGASLHSFSIPLEGQPFSVIDHYPNLEEAQNEVGLSFKSSKLSPFPCRIAGGKYLWDEKSYELRKKFLDGSAIHGLLFDKPFEVVDERADERMASLVLKYDYDGVDPGYPFRYRCEIRYLLEPDGLLGIETMVSNLGPVNIPLADGWHPYFQLGGSVDDWLLSFDGQQIVEFDKALIPTGKMTAYHFFNEPRPVAAQQLDNCFLLKLSPRQPVCELVNPGNGLQLLFFASPGYPYLQLFTPPGRRSIAVENLSAAPDCFNNGMGLIRLPAHRSSSFGLQYQIKII